MAEGLPLDFDDSTWDYGTSDADFCDEGGKGPTRFIYEQNSQGSAHSGFSGKAGYFYQLGLFDGNEFEFLSSFLKEEVPVGQQAQSPTQAPAPQKTDDDASAMRSEYGALCAR